MICISNLLQDTKYGATVRRLLASLSIKTGNKGETDTLVLSEGNKKNHPSTPRKWDYILARCSDYLKSLLVAWLTHSDDNILIYQRNRPAHTPILETMNVVFIEFGFCMN